MISTGHGDQRDGSNDPQRPLPGRARLGRKGLQGQTHESTSDIGPPDSDNLSEQVMAINVMAPTILNARFRPLLEVSNLNFETGVCMINTR